VLSVFDLLRRCVRDYRLQRRQQPRVRVVFDLLLNTVRDYRLQRNQQPPVRIVHDLLRGHRVRDFRLPGGWLNHQQPRVRGVRAALLGGHRLRGNPMHPDHQPGLRTAPTAWYCVLGLRKGQVSVRLRGRRSGRRRLHGPR